MEGLNFPQKTGMESKDVKPFAMKNCAQLHLVVLALSKYLITDTPLVWHCLLTLTSSFSFVILSLAASQRSFTVHPR